MDSTLKGFAFTVSIICYLFFRHVTFSGDCCIPSRLIFSLNMALMKIYRSVSHFNGPSIINFRPSKLKSRRFLVFVEFRLLWRAKMRLLDRCNYFHGSWSWITITLLSTYYQIAKYLKRLNSSLAILFQILWVCLRTVLIFLSRKKFASLEFSPLLSPFLSYLQSR